MSMKTIKIIFSIFLSAIFIFCLAACEVPNTEVNDVVEQEYEQALLSSGFTHEDSIVPSELWLDAISNTLDEFNSANPNMSMYYMNGYQIVDPNNGRLEPYFKSHELFLDGDIARYGSSFFYFDSNSFMVKDSNGTRALGARIDGKTLAEHTYEYHTFERSGSTYKYDFIPLIYMLRDELSDFSLHEVVNEHGITEYGFITSREDGLAIWDLYDFSVVLGGKRYFTNTLLCKVIIEDNKITDINFHCEKATSSFWLWIGFEYGNVELILP